jgi:hypothetical protein
MTKASCNSDLTLPTGLLRFARNDMMKGLSLREAAATKQSQRHRDSWEKAKIGNAECDSFGRSGSDSCQKNS